jgi:hypothetical protein
MTIRNKNHTSNCSMLKKKRKYESYGVKNKNLNFLNHIIKNIFILKKKKKVVVFVLYKYI